jgi:thiamine biosynthesis lipoprotein
MTNHEYSQSAEALGTTIDLRLVAPSKAWAETWFSKLWQAISEFEADFSRFLPDSQLTRLNRSAGLRVSVTDEFKQLLAEMKRFADLSHGYFNPFILPALQKAGYLRSLSRKNSNLPALDYTERRIAKMEELEIGKTWARIPPNTALDSGGIGKGYLADKLSEILDEGGFDSYCLSIGGDMIMKGELPGGTKRRVGVQSVDDLSEDEMVYVSDGSRTGLATSGLSRAKDGKRQFHQIESGKSAKTKYDMCTVVAEDATIADVMASSVLMGGRPLAEKLLAGDIVKTVLLQRRGDQPVIVGDDSVLSLVRKTEFAHAR